MFEIPRESVKLLEDYDCEVRTSRRAEIATYSKKGELLDVISPSVDYADVIDKSTGKVYITETGDDRISAIVNACAKIPFTQKPLTRSQEKIQANGLEAAGDKARIAELEAKLAGLTAHVNAAPGISGIVPQAQLASVPDLATLANKDDEDEEPDTSGFAPPGIKPVAVAAKGKLASGKKKR